MNGSMCFGFIGAKVYYSSKIGLPLTSSVPWEHMKDFSQNNELRFLEYNGNVIHTFRCSDCFAIFSRLTRCANWLIYVHTGLITNTAFLVSTYYMDVFPPQKVRAPCLLSPWPSSSSPKANLAFFSLPIRMRNYFLAVVVGWCHRANS